MPIPIVTVASLIAKGYPVSTLKSESQVTLADSDIKEAYFPSTELFTDTKTPELHVSATRDRNTVVVTCREPASTDQTTVAFDLNDLNSRVTEHNLYKLASMWKSNISGALSVYQLSENISKELSDILKMYKDSTRPTALTSVVALDKAFLSYGRPAK